MDNISKEPKIENLLTHIVIKTKDGQQFEVDTELSFNDWVHLNYENEDFGLLYLDKGIEGSQCINKLWVLSLTEVI